MPPADETDPGRTPPDVLRTVEANRIPTAGNERPIVAESCDVAVEAPVTIEIAHVGAYTLMCSPCDLRALAVGFMFTEGMIRSLDDIGALSECTDDPDILRVQLADPSRATARERALVISSSCGLCGSKSLQELLRMLPTVGNALQVKAEALRRATVSLREHQRIFPRTGGTHAAGIFGATGSIFAFAEDIGRHNALDKAIGGCLLAGRTMAGCGVALSGRVSLEMVVKSARAGLEVMAAVSAPTSLAVEAASCCNITLCGFVRGESATVYTRPGRIQQT